MPTTPNMSLLLPSPTITPGPTYASENNTAFEVIDDHDHTLGKGLPVPSLGININNDLPFNGFNATNLRSTQYQNQTSPLSLPADLTCVYVVNGNLWYNNGIGQQVQLTAGNTLNAASIGGIGGDYVGSGALVFYTSADKTFTFWSATNTPANIDAGSIIIRQVSLSPNGITLQSPLSLAASYSLTLPTALPGATSFVTMDSSGNILTTIPVAAGITTSNIASQAITQPLLAPRTIATNSDPGVGGVALSSPITFAATGNANHTVTGLTVTLTTSGRPVYVGLQPSSTNVNCTLLLNADGVTIETTGGLGGAGVWLNYISPSSPGYYQAAAAFIDTTVAGTPGTYTYQVSTIGDSSGASYELGNVVMIAYEI